MNFKRHWDYNKEGLTKIYELSNSACHTMEVDGLKLSAGACFEGNTGENEIGIVLLPSLPDTESLR